MIVIIDAVCIIIASILPTKDTFIVILLVLAMAFAAVMQKTRSLWPAALFNAGMDISVMLGIFSNLG